MAQKNITLGLVAHVDSGKTTLTEAMLVGAGALRQAGRVDHGDAFLDTHALERSRGITIFAKEARLTLPHTELTLLDTPGHADFGAEMERTLSVLDYALLIISGTDGVQAHAETLWRLLERYGIPTFLFVNKMDLAGADRGRLLAELRGRLGEGCVDFGPGRDREALLELTCHADALAFGEDSVWAGRTDKRDYDDRQRTCYEYAARLREERFTFHSSDTFRTYICRIVLGGDFSDFVTRWHPMGR